MIRHARHFYRQLMLAGLTTLIALDCSFAGPPAIAIIIDDLGYRYDEGQRAVALPGAIACAVIPNTPHGTRMAEIAHATGKEILLHLPMQPLDPERPVGADGIAMETTRRGVTQALVSGMDSIPHVIGVNNHMGSLITRHPGHMTWLMQELLERDLFFVDSVTTESSVALNMAREQGVTSTRRDVFLDFEDATEGQVQRQLEKLYASARSQGHALGIGHPYPATMAVLERELPRLAAHGIQLVSVRELIALRSDETVSKTSVSTNSARDTTTH